MRSRGSPTPRPGCSAAWRSSACRWSWMTRSYNCAAVIHRGQVLGVVPKSYLPTYKEFYDARFFAPAATAYSSTVRLFGRRRAVRHRPALPLRERARTSSSASRSARTCGARCRPARSRPSHGATVLLNLSASNETIAKANYRAEPGHASSRPGASPHTPTRPRGPGESTTDLVFGGHCLIAENGAMLAESERFRRDEQLTRRRRRPRPAAHRTATRRPASTTRS